MNPVAKWIKINADGSFQSGNGWLQHSQGTWNYNSDNNIYSAIDALGVIDEFGGFVVSFDQEKMIWEREEEGMRIRVTLLPIDKLPMAPANYLIGIWELIEITDDNESEQRNVNASNSHKLYFGWDRIYRNFSPEGKKLTGYWHIHGHKPEITLLPHSESKSAESWKIDVNKETLIMQGISDNNRSIKRKYARRNKF